MVHKKLKISFYKLLNFSFFKLSSLVSGEKYMHVVSSSAADINLADRFSWVCLRLYMSMTTVVEDEQPKRYDSIL
jgi:hypothetical protein